MPHVALLIPVKGPLEFVELTEDDGASLDQLQSLVGGNIEAINLPEFIDGSGKTTAYVHEEGKYECEPNMRATDFMVPGIGLFPGDYVAGPFLLCGFDPTRGEHDELPADVIKRAKLIESEAG